MRLGGRRCAAAKPHAARLSSIFNVTFCGAWG
jgi:hypothetical protein